MAQLQLLTHERCRVVGCGQESKSRLFNRLGHDMGTYCAAHDLAAFHALGGQEDADKVWHAMLGISLPEPRDGVSR